MGFIASCSLFAERRVSGEVGRFFVTRARSCTRFVRTIEDELSSRALIGQELFENFMKGQGAISVRAEAVKSGKRADDSLCTGTKC